MMMTIFVLLIKNINTPTVANLQVTQSPSESEGCIISFSGVKSETKSEKLFPEIWDIMES